MRTSSPSCLRRFVISRCLQNKSRQTSLSRARTSFRGAPCPGIQYRLLTSAAPGVACINRFALTATVFQGCRHNCKGRSTGLHSSLCSVWRCVSFISQWLNDGPRFFQTAALWWYFINAPHKQGGSPLSRLRSSLESLGQSCFLKPIFNHVRIATLL